MIETAAGFAIDLAEADVVVEGRQSEYFGVCFVAAVAVSVARAVEFGAAAAAVGLIRWAYLRQTLVFRLYLYPKVFSPAVLVFQFFQFFQFFRKPKVFQRVWVFSERTCKNLSFRLDFVG